MRSNSFLFSSLLLMFDDTEETVEETGDVASNEAGEPEAEADSESTEDEGSDESDAAPVEEAAAEEETPPESEG